MPFDFPKVKNLRSTISDAELIALSQDTTVRRSETDPVPVTRLEITRGHVDVRVISSVDRSGDDICARRRIRLRDGNSKVLGVGADRLYDNVSNGVMESMQVPNRKAKVDDNQSIEGLTVHLMSCEPWVSHPDELEGAVI